MYFKNGKPVSVKKKLEFDSWKRLLLFTFEGMQVTNQSGIRIENCIVFSRFLKRNVEFDLYIPSLNKDIFELLLINDGQDLSKFGFHSIFSTFIEANKIKPIIAVGIHAGKERKLEYGIAGKPDYLGRGNRAEAYTQFILQELLPFIDNRFKIQFIKKAFAGFSLGGLTALDIVWKHADVFSIAGIFSGSLWWRSVDQHDEQYDDDIHRIMHQQIKHGKYKPGLKFFFTTGSLDETNDRNNNGIIDSIDDTISLIQHLEELGYKEPGDIFYINYADGRHDMETWGRAMPVFLKWAFAS